MTIPSMNELRQQEHGNDVAFNYEVAFYHGQCAVLDYFNRNHGDDPAIAESIKYLAAAITADMAAEIGG